MGKILTGYKSAVINDIVHSSNYYYMFASNPITSTTIPLVTNDDYSSKFIDGWQMLFGKRVKPADIKPVVRNIQWTSGTVYDMYDNTKDMSTKNFYVVTPTDIGGDYVIYKCIYNNGGSASTEKPDIIQPKSFTKTDGYTWRYITSITNADYVKFATSSYIPIYGNTTTQAASLINSGVEVVQIPNSGNGYSSYHDGFIQSVQSTTLLQIESTASINNEFYVNNGIYIYNDLSATSDLNVITQYVSNATGNWVYLSAEANVNIINPGSTRYKISPRVVFNTNGTTPSKAYSVINTSSNSISNVVIIDTGTSVSWANVHLESNSIFGSGANLYAIVAPPGGHGFDPTDELSIKGFSISTTFANNENETIPTEVTYNKIGLIKNPYQLNNSTGGKLELPMIANTFSAVSNFTPLNGTVFTVGDTLTSNITSTIGTVAFSNSTVLMMTGDKTYQDGESLVSSDGQLSTGVYINTLGDVFTKDIRPMYVQNITDVTRSNTTSESYKLIIQI